MTYPNEYANHPLAGTIARAYLDGEHVHEIADELEVSRHVVASCVKGLTFGANRDAMIRQQRQDGQSVQELAEQWGLTTYAVYKIVGQSAPQGPVRARPDAKTLIQLTQHKRTKEIAQMYGVRADTVLKWLRCARVQLGLPPQNNRRNGRVLPHDAKLLHLFGQHTAQEIAQMFGVHPWTVHRAIKRARQRMEVLRPVIPDEPCEAGAPTYVELEDALERWGMDGVAEEYDVDYQTVSRWMRAYDL